MKTGIGYDIHPLAKGRKLILGGEEIDHPLGLQGHSDADVLTHAICDALLGAAGEGDIGRHFPDTDDRFRGVSSLKLLSEVCRMLARKQLEIINVDATLIIEAPRVAALVPSMVKNLAGAMGIDPSRVNVKATTHEGVGALGRGEAIAALAVASIEIWKHRNKWPIT